MWPKSQYVHSKHLDFWHFYMHFLHLKIYRKSIFKNFSLIILIVMFFFFLFTIIRSGMGSPTGRVFRRGLYQICTAGRIDWIIYQLAAENFQSKYLICTAKRTDRGLVYLRNRNYVKLRGDKNFSKLMTNSKWFWKEHGKRAHGIWMDGKGWLKINFCPTITSIYVVIHSLK